MIRFILSTYLKVMPCIEHGITDNLDLQIEDLPNLIYNTAMWTSDNTSRINYCHGFISSSPTASLYWATKFSKPLLSNSARSFSLNSRKAIDLPRAFWLDITADLILSIKKTSGLPPSSTYFSNSTGTSTGLCSLPAN